MKRISGVSLATTFGTMLSLLTLAFTIACTKQVDHHGAQERTRAMVTEVKIQSASAGSSAAATRLAKLKTAHLINSVDMGALALDDSAASPAGAPTTPATSPAPAVSGQVTLLKSEILNRVFLFGSDLQYSSIGDPDDNMLTQALSPGHLPANFQILGDRLQLIADQTYMFESNVNHPGQLIHEFPIVSQDDQSVTITINEASPILANILGGEADPGPSPAVQNTWVRSVEFVPQGNYLLIESSVERVDGSIGEFMESIFPRDSIVPANVTPMFNDKALNPLADRYRFLGGDPVYLDLPAGRTKTRVMEHYLVTAQSGLIEWYVTANIPSQYLPAIKAGVEGWNRYSQKMWGRDMMRFDGVLPANVKIGDPRYNVINWDSVPDATAAYESQSQDPTTGIQSHSLIYLPFSWVKIGQQYWQDYAVTQNPGAAANSALQAMFANGTFGGTGLHINCFHDLEQTVSLEAIRSPDTFAFELLKQVLFHEVGHALGLAHNFKGSLAFNPTDPNPTFSTSIMDYNQYEVEDAAFDSRDVSTGPLLEYDRQAISAIYNGSADVASTDPVVPTCEDSEADGNKGGTDPYCIRYDLGSDPTNEMVLTRQLIDDPTAHIARAQSMATSLNNSLSVLGDATTVPDAATANTRLGQLLTQVQAVSKYYISDGAQSLSYMTRSNIKSLWVYRSQLLPSPLDPTAQRARVAAMVSYVTSMTQLSDSARAAYANVVAQATAWLNSTAWYQSLPDAQKPAAVTAALNNLSSAEANLEANLLPIVRTKVMGSLTRDPNAPYFFLVDASGTTTDYEKTSIQLLHDAVVLPLAGNMRSITERTAAVTALKTFKDAPEMATALTDIANELQTELSNVKTATDREALRGLLALVNQ